MRTFILTDDDEKKVEKFRRQQDKVWKKKQKPVDIDPYYGAIGGSMTYSFTPTNIGTVVKVEHATGAVLDISDYEHW
jgi:hypothetical protein